MMAMAMATSCSKHLTVATRRRQRAVMGMWLLALAASTRVPMAIANRHNNLDGRRDDEINVSCRCPYPDESYAVNLFQRRKRKGTSQYYNDGEDIDATDYVITSDGDKIVPMDHPSCRYIEFICPGESAAFPIWDYNCVADVLLSPTSTPGMGSSKGTGGTKKKKNQRRPTPPSGFPSVSAIGKPSPSPTLATSFKSVKALKKRNRRRRPRPAGAPTEEPTAALEPRSPKKKRRRPPRDLKHSKSDETSEEDQMDPDAPETLSPSLGDTSDNIFHRGDAFLLEDSNIRARKEGNGIKKSESFSDADVQGIDRAELRQKRKDKTSSAKASRKSTKGKKSHMITAAPTMESSSTVAPVSALTNTPTIENSSTVAPMSSPTNTATSSPISTGQISSSKRAKRKSIKGMKSKKTRISESLPLSDASSAPSADDTSPPNLRATNGPSTSLPAKSAKEMGRKKIKQKKQQQDISEGPIITTASKSTKKKKRDRHGANSLGGNVEDSVLSRKSGKIDNSDDIITTSKSSKMKKKRPKADGAETISSKGTIPWKTVVLPLSSPLCGSATFAPAPVVQTGNPVTETPVAAPVELLTESPSEVPPTSTPLAIPTLFPTSTFLPTSSAIPTQIPSSVPVLPILSALPEATSNKPTVQPMTESPTAQPVLLIVSISESPSAQQVISIVPTDETLTDQPDEMVPEADLQGAPTQGPSVTPTIWTWSPSPSPWPFAPSHSPSRIPSISPTIHPTGQPTTWSQSPWPSSPSPVPSEDPSSQPTTRPSISLPPSTEPTRNPSISPSLSPTIRSIEVPSIAPIVSSSIPPSKRAIEPSLDPSTEPSAKTTFDFLFKNWLPWTDNPSTSASVLPSDSPSKSPTAFPSFDAGASMDQTAHTERTVNIYEAQSLLNPAGVSNTRQGLIQNTVETDTMQDGSSPSDSGRSPSMFEAIRTIIRPSSISSEINKSFSSQGTPEPAQDGGGIFDVFRQPGHRRKLRGDISESDFSNGEKTHYS